MDIILVAVSLTGSLIMYGRPVHIGAGTLAAAVLVGNIVRWMKRAFAKDSRCL